MFEKKFLSQGDYAWHDSIEVCAKQNISADGKLFIDYGSNCFFQKWLAD